MTESFGEWFSVHQGTIVYCVLLLGIGLPLLRFVGYLIRRGLRKKTSEQSIMLLSKGVVYLGSTIVVLMVLQKAGVQLGTLLGAAGIAGVAIGFASQTSLSNLISGLFLIWERPFAVGDVLHVGTDHGTVFSIDLLSVQLRTFNNQLIRIPNETLIKGSFTNVTRFPIRRMDIPIGVAYKEDIEKVIRILKEVANANPLCLDEPEPIVVFKGFGDSALEFLFGPWFAKADYVNLRNSLLMEVKKRFDAEGIEIPFPHRTLYAGEATKPFPVHVVPAPSESPAQPSS
ncbi:Small-conductance mechanosensitive channel [Pontiella desulfatans]|uniref:Small-conductance mechanosensitive channel n=1 Tax=Pontiella desulfatans TaxID=2750659 RepID=A0A6C2U9K0_PONDE|nr:mechanosensitive ion channel family protein [Pontiella desulfatans]VGO16782.1 Small-conductance mechanosensitive channel [Pontiella desulfatans]